MNKGTNQEPVEVMVDGAQFWRECPEDGARVGALPVKLVFTLDNINGLLVFFEAHSITISDQAVAQIRQEIETQGEAAVWLLTQR